MEGKIMIVVLAYVIIVYSIQVFFASICIYIYIYL